MYNFFLRRKIKKILNLSERQKAYLNLSEIKSILVLFGTENFSDANYFIQQMRKMKKKISAFAIKNKKDTKDYSNISYTVVTEKDMKNLKGDSLLQIVNSLSRKKIDLIVDLTLEENLLLLYVLVSVNAPLKVGFYKHSLPVHDMVISFAPDLVQNVKELGKHLIHYLTIISSESKNDR